MQPICMVCYVAADIQSDCRMAFGFGLLQSTATLDRLATAWQQVPVPRGNHKGGKNAMHVWVQAAAVKADFANFEKKLQQQGSQASGSVNRPGHVLPPDLAANATHFPGTPSRPPSFHGQRHMECICGNMLLHMQRQYLFLYASK